MDCNKFAKKKKIMSVSVSTGKVWNLVTDYLNLVTDDAYCHPMFQSPTSFKNVQQLYYQNWFNTSKDTCQFDFLKILMHRSTLFSLQNFHYIFFKDKSSTVDISSNLPWWNLFKCQSNRTFNILYAWGIGINWGEIIVDVNFIVYKIPTLSLTRSI